MRRFDWLVKEIRDINTPRFHVVEGPADPKMQDAVLGSSLPVPKSYKQFILKFGNARLYRSDRAGYRIGVFASPREAVLGDGTRIYHLGFHDGASVYVKPPSGSAGLPIFEFEEDPEEKVADSFEQWLMAACTRARKSYGKRGWAKIMRGPPPFTPEELEIVTARRLIRWRVLGIDSEGEQIFEVKNAGDRVLPALTIGIRSKSGHLNGAVRLKIAHIKPGQTDVLHVGCYKGLVQPQEIEAFELPDPKPEDREYYWEFRGTGKQP